MISLLRRFFRRVVSSRAASVFRAGTRARYLVLTVLLMVGFYAILYHPYAEDSWPAQALTQYLRVTANASVWVLQLLGESASASDTQVFGRFPYVVVLDCAALDAQALFAAAVLAFPARAWTKVLGVVLGLSAIFGINVARLVLLYFAGARSRELFHVLHEEVMVFAVIALVCLMFLLWAQLALRTGRKSAVVSLPAA
jgi:exosortase/archaeosortase family protein